MESDQYFKYYLIDIELKSDVHELFPKGEVRILLIIALQRPESPVKLQLDDEGAGWEVK